MSAIGPVPFAGMLFADLGADVIRVDRPTDRPPRDAPAAASSACDDSAATLITRRGRRSIVLDLKTEAGRSVLMELVKRADILLEGGRPGVMERLSIGPDDCLAVNARLVYGRATGWGQDGPYAHYAAHDINFLALTGALWAIGRPDERPTPPLNLLGDYGGGGMYLAFGALCALLEARNSGTGQVVDAAIVDGVASMSALHWEMRARGLTRDQRGSNLLDTGAPFYDVYECADGKFIALGAVEPRFFAEFCMAAGIPVDRFMRDRLRHAPKEQWPELKQAIADLIATRTQDEWCQSLEFTDACFAPVLSWTEAVDHPHNVARTVFEEVDGVVQPAPAPRFSRTPGQIRPSALPGADTEQILAECGFTTEDIRTLHAQGGLG
jgi:alpha-methylacyl-CoA racemase